MALSKTKIKRRTNAFHNYKTLVARISYKCMTMKIEADHLKLELNSPKSSIKSEDWGAAQDARRGLKREIKRLRDIQGRRRIVNAGKIKAAISQY